jgi:NCS1 family nucleobase:cation symporter-1
MFAILGVIMHQAGGNFNGSTVTQGAHARGSTLVWSFFSNMNSVIGTYATLAVNIGDFSRYSKTPKANWVQVVVIPCGITLVATLGILSAAASEKVYGEIYWDPSQIIDNWTSRGGRAGAAFVAIG